MEAVSAPGGRTLEDDEGALTAPTGGVRALLAALTARGLHDPVVAERLVDLARRIAARLKLDAAEVSVVARVALLHDVGRIGMPDSLLDKQGELDERERPPDHEGLIQCELQKAWLPAVTEVLAVALVLLAVVHLALVMLPRQWRRWRAGELRESRRAGTAKPGKPPPFESDPVLMAATWGMTYDDANPRSRPRRTARAQSDADADARAPAR